MKNKIDNNLSYKRQKSYCFVYGSLKKGFYNHHYLKDSKYIDEGFISNYYLLSINNKRYPALLKGKGIVKGEVYLVDRLSLKNLDVLEATREKLYIRIYDKVFLKNKKRKVNSYIYIYHTKLETKKLNRTSF